MKIIVAKSAGFCFGVSRAVDMLYDVINNSQKRIFTIGPIIHNPQIINEIKEKNVTIVDDVNDVLPGSVAVIRAHGIPKEQLEILKQKDAIIVDTTCPYVAKIHKIVSEASQKGHIVLIAGDKFHPEVVGIKSHADECYVFADEKELEIIINDIKNTKKQITVVSQTTFRTDIFKICQKNIKKIFENSIIYDTICSATEKRQREASEIAAKTDAMIVVGGAQSSNTNKLFSICKQKCNATFFAQSADEIPANLLKNFKMVGITAGASTPDCVIEEVKKFMSEQTKSVAVDEELTFEQMLNESFKTISNGERVKGIVVGVDSSEVKVDLGIKQSGFISRDNFSADSSIDLVNEVKIGDEIEAVVLRVNDVEGTVALSKKKIDAAKGFEEVSKAYEGKELVSGPVTEITNGGIVALYNGVRVFIPMSLTGKPKGFDFATIKGETVEFNIIEFSQNRGRRKIIGSMKAHLYEERKKLREAFWANANVGDKILGTVKSLTSFGAFVDLGGVDGLVHITELSWKKIKHPQEVVSVGDKIEVYIKELDKEAKKVSLGYKKDEDNPFKKFLANYKVGDVVKVKIVSVMPFGAFANITDDVDGLIHISQLSDKRVEKPADIVKVGDEVDVKIIEIDTEKGKVGLSMKALIEPKEEPVDEAAAEFIEKTEE